jgi:hypothetical protein
MKLKLEKRTSYGRNLVYPSCVKSNILCKLSGKACFNKQALAMLKQLGYEHNLSAKDLEDVL